jgi:hypothetical protein
LPKPSPRDYLRHRQLPIQQLTIRQPPNQTW